MGLISAGGFDTVVTTAPKAVHRFWAQHQRVIYESAIRTRSIVAELDAGDVHRIPDVDACHTQFQVGERDKPWEARYESGWRGHVDRDKWPIELLTNWSAGLSKYQAFPTNAM